ncbi:MAG: hypothetical protein HC905_32095 [Bacteroidales bacterium]|nr:hypothetical protein [Bacteroidales bacterium]
MKGIFYLIFFLLFIAVKSFCDTEDYEYRKKVIIDFAADIYHVPVPNYMDPEKVYWPVTIARLYKYGLNDSLANKYIDSEVFLNRKPFHFIYVGMARLFPLYSHAPAMKKNKLIYLKNISERRDSYNPWTCEGTENHVNMSRTSGYIFAGLMEEYPGEFPDAASRKKEMKDWIKYYSKTIFYTGTGEFNASTYGIYNIIGWLNLFDFAKDKEVKEMARAVLDYYASELALHYTQGMTGGAESRGEPSVKGCDKETDILSWLWFGNASFNVEDELKKNKNNKNPLQVVHAATSSYFPPKQIVDLASNKYKGSFYCNSKPAYLLDNPSIYKNFSMPVKFTLGSACYPYGAFASSTYKNVTWKMIAKVDDEEMKHPQMITGGGLYYSDRKGRMRNPWLQTVQYKNILIQLNKMPVNAGEIVDSIKKTFVIGMNCGEKI